MDLTTDYLGLKLSNPLILGSSPMSDDLDALRKVETSGAAAIVMHSLYEEQITRDRVGRLWYDEMYTNVAADAPLYYPRVDQFSHTPQQYLQRIRVLKETLYIPVIASINCTTRGQWAKFADLIQGAGADALELNIYMLPTNPEEPGADVEKRVVDIVGLVREKITIPLAVKLSPYYTSLPHLLRQLETAGTSGVVLFNRFYQPDFDIRKRSVAPKLHLSDASDPTELRLRLRWLSILSPQTRLSLGLTGGIHSGEDVIKGIMAGAHAIQIVSTLLRHGPEYVAQILDEMKACLAEIGVESIEALRGSLNHRLSADPAAVERGGYLSVIHQWKPDSIRAPSLVK
jgi:dihydroorotate dehydrogenase (fumarate)